MVAEGVTQRRSGKEGWYGAENKSYGVEDGYTAWRILRGYYEADDGVHEVAGEYWWSDRSSGDADKNVQGEDVNKCSRLDEKKTMSIYIELDGSDDVAEDAFRVENGRRRTTTRGDDGRKK